MYTDTIHRSLRDHAGHSVAQTQLAGGSSRALVLLCTCRATPLAVPKQNHGGCIQPTPALQTSFGCPLGSPACLACSTGPPCKSSTVYFWHTVVSRSACACCGCAGDALSLREARWLGVHRHSPVTVQLNAQVSSLAPDNPEPAVLTPVRAPAAITISYNSGHAGHHEH